MFSALFQELVHQFRDALQACFVGKADGSLTDTSEQGNELLEGANRENGKNRTLRFSGHP